MNTTRIARNARRVGLIDGILVLLAFSAAPVLLADEEPVTATAAAASSVDTRGGDARVVGTASIAYSPFWGGAAGAGSYAVIEKIEHADMFNETESTLSTCAADTEGVLPFAPASGDPQCVRLVHRTYDSGGIQIGEALVRDVSFGCVSGPGAAAKVDCRGESLREAVVPAMRSKSPVMLAYDTAWATNGVPADVTISAVSLAGEGGAPVATNGFFTAVAPANGAAPLRGVPSGWTRLVCRIAGDGGATLLEYVSGDFFLKDFSTFIYLR